MVVDTENPVVDILGVVDKNNSVVDSPLVVDTKNKMSTTEPQEKVVDIKEEIKVETAEIKIDIELVEPSNVEPKPNNAESCPHCPELEKQLEQLNHKLEIKKESEEKLVKETKLLEIQKDKYRQIVQNLQVRNRSLIQNITKLENQSKSKDNYQPIPKSTNFISLFYSKDYKKFVSHSCTDSC
ncbi:19365_t:CDS:2 [Racocetra persica]|uniref:19365_t:CDS:1 n=1 Tax=Racocetra persica TaxID=160502 RepID=A0ACA9M3N5_9GLOM|nr:19365_t:CDS:2 [Racocetra persica]